MGKPKDDPSIEKLVYANGDFIFLEGDRESHFYIIEKGSVRISTKNINGKTVTICRLCEGESFGEFALLDDKPRSASAQAIGEVVVIKVSEADYQKLLSELPGWAISMMRGFIIRLKNMNDKIKEDDHFVNTSSSIEYANEDSLPPPVPASVSDNSHVTLRAPLESVSINENTQTGTFGLGTLSGIEEVSLFEAMPDSPRNRKLRTETNSHITSVPTEESTESDDLNSKWINLTEQHRPVLTKLNETMMNKTDFTAPQSLSEKTKSGIKSTADFFTRKIEKK